MFNLFRYVEIIIIFITYYIFSYRSENLDNRLRKNDENFRYVDNDSDDNKEEEFVLENRRNNQLVTDLDNLEEEQLGASKDEYWSEESESLGQKSLLGKFKK